MYFFGSKDTTNKELIEQIILEKYHLYYRLAYQYVHNEADASDIVQSGAYKAIKGSSRLKHPEYAETWIYRIMLNECFDCLKRQKSVSYDAWMEREGMEPVSIEDHCVNLDLQRAIDSLPPKDKAIVILRYFEDKKIEEIGEILNENVNTVKSRLYRSMTKLRDTLSEDGKNKKAL